MYIHIDIYIYMYMYIYIYILHIKYKWAASLLGAPISVCRQAERVKFRVWLLEFGVPRLQLEAQMAGLFAGFGRPCLSMA